METKTCLKCNEAKTFDCFSTEKRKNGNAYTRKVCKKCKSKQCNIETVRAKNNRWNANHREYRKQWQKDNRDYLSAKDMERYHSDPNYRLRKILRANLKIRLDRMFSGVKVGSAVKDLGCSIEQLKIHIESQFQEGMTWENHSSEGWHLDHKKPLSFFDLTDREQFLEANHYTNLQPLWAKDNLEKSDMYEGQSGRNFRADNEC